MEIREYRGYDEGEILSLYERVGWRAYTSRPEVLRKGFEGSLLKLAAYEGGKLLGLVRVVGDGQTVVFIQDLLVVPEHQRKGIGSALLKAVLGQYSHVSQILLITDESPETRAFYEVNGFCSLAGKGCCGFMKA